MDDVNINWENHLSKNFAKGLILKHKRNEDTSMLLDYSSSKRYEDCDDRKNMRKLGIEEEQALGEFKTLKAEEASLTIPHI